MEGGEEAGEMAVVEAQATQEGASAGEEEEQALVGQTRRSVLRRMWLRYRAGGEEATQAFRCRMVPARHPRATVASRARPATSIRVSTSFQGLTLVHFSAQLEPCMSQENTLHTLNNP